MNDSRPTYGRLGPFNTNPDWPDGYFQVLEDLGIAERFRPFYAHWVRRFFKAYPGRRRRELGPGEIDAFVVGLSNESGVAAWQVGQARGALEIHWTRCSLNDHMTSQVRENSALDAVTTGCRCLCQL